MTAPVIVWLRRDLRLADQAAFRAAAESGAPVIPVFILDDETAGARRRGGASRWWLHHSLESLGAALTACGSRLVLRRGAAPGALASLVAQTGADTIHALRHEEPWWRAAEAEVARGKARLCLHDGNYLAPPGSVRTGGGQLYRIYTPFWRALQQQLPPPPPTPAPRRLRAPDAWPQTDSLADWRLLPQRPDWAGGLREAWTPGEAGANRALAAFVTHAGRYGEARNHPASPGTSRLSPHLHHGEISAASVWHRLADAGGSVASFLGELGWRDYAQTIIRQFPDYGETPARAMFARFGWRSGQAAASDLAAWQQGRTGYPIVDAGMRQLWVSGWMHNRVRMIAASFLVKHLLIDWRRGERWFWDTLVDADYASNAVNWQWIAGSGVDANMFPRIMAPLTQSVKFAAAAYIRHWVPELRAFDDEAIHDPPPGTKGYAERLIGHRAARERALAAYARVKA
ncbi:MAG: deoxyribodipyrimidine photo-lyase [Sphingomonadales bacterium]|nr:deoxyribodipyrimidine photo-lyase [Sphingomonadales bacterium]